MFRALSAHLQEDTIVYMQLSDHSLSENSLKLCTDRPPGTLIESDGTICCMYTIVPTWRWTHKARNI